jgi:hypothetical protein
MSNPWQHEQAFIRGRSETEDRMGYFEDEDQHSILQRTGKR